MTNENDEVPEIEFYTSGSILGANPFADIEELYLSYLETLKALHEDIVDTSAHRSTFRTLIVGTMKEDWYSRSYDTNSVLIPNSTVIVFGVVFVDGKPKVVTTVQANLLMHIPRSSVFINNVATNEKFKLKGFGKKAMIYLEQWINEHWMLEERQIKLLLTNSPKKNNGGFYLTLGYEARNEESKKPTVVWQKYIKRSKHRR